MYKGVTPTILKQGSNQAIRFFVMETLKDGYRQYRGDKTTGLPVPKLLTGLFGIIAGAASVYGNTPLDVVKTRMQGLDAHKYKNTLHCAWKIWTEEGFFACQEVLDRKKHHHKKWISIETLSKIQERKNKKTTTNNSRTRAENVKAQSEYAEVNKQAKKISRVDEQKCVEDLTMTAEKSVREGNMKQPTKKLAGKYNKPERPIKDKEGKPITELQG
ncbi:unnamed protein product [Schistosoma curassoni]|uniref:Citrate transport protein n=1 Tax=Schistosoma curassoni TaxID=6186 RepID=A0A183KIR5_9TREM|nr:unnamed protein product [Schistosoma curassoni]